MTLIIFIYLVMVSIFITDLIFKAPPAALKKSVKRLRKRSREKVDYNKEFSERVIKPVLNALYNKVHIDLFNMSAIGEKLDRLGINMTSEEFIAGSLIKTIVFIFLGIVVQILIKQPIISSVLIFLGVILFFASIIDLDQKIKKHNDAIIVELPRFIKTCMNQYQLHIPLTGIVQTYIEVAGKDLRLELIKLYSDLQMYDEKESLIRFSDRISIPVVHNFATTLINAYGSGVNVDQQFMIQSVEVRTLNRENVRKRLGDIPNKMQAYLAIPFIALIILMGAPSIISMVQRFSKGF